MTQNQPGWIFSPLFGLSTGVETNGQLPKYLENGSYLKFQRNLNFLGFLNFAKMPPKGFEHGITQAGGGVEGQDTCHWIALFKDLKSTPFHFPVTPNQF